MRRRARNPGFDADVAVVGAGIVGLTLAGALAHSTPWTVSVLERAPVAPAADDNEPDPRTLALTVASVRLLSAFGAWQRLPPAQRGPVRRMVVWDARGSGRIEFDAAEVGEPELATIVENRRLLAAVDAAVGGYAHVRRERAAELTGFEVDTTAVTLALAGGRRLRVRLVVGADGAGSRVRELAGIDFIHTPYRQAAVVCVLGTELAHDETARQVFLADGPLALLPLAQAHTCALVWSTTPEHAQRLCALGEADFCAELGAACGHALGRIEHCGRREAWPLSRGRATRYVGERVVLVGDAAHVIHPLAGQGANLGLMDAAALAECLGHAHEDDRDPGGLATLRRFERWRKGENLFMQMAMDGLRSLFAADADPLVRLRNTGLSLVDGMRPVKAAIMRRASGVAGDLPALARAH